MVEQNEHRGHSASEREAGTNRSFHALADPSRRRIVELLREAGELKVGDVAAAFAMSLNGVSKHLKVLERAEIVRRRIDGREHWIRVDWNSLRLPYEWLHFHRNYWSKRLDSLNGYFTTENANDRE